MNVSEEKTVFPQEQKPVPIHESWVKRNGLWFFPLLIFVVGVPAICCGSFMFGIGWFASLITAPKEAAIVALQQDSRVTEKIGTEIFSKNQVNFSNLQINDDNGFVELSFAVNGNKGDATVNGKMQMIAGEWSAERLVVTFDDGTEIIIPQDSD